MAANCLIYCELLCAPLVRFHQGNICYCADIQRVSRHGAREALQEELAVGIGLAGEGERVGAGGGGHAPEADGAGADVGVDEAADGREGAGEAIGQDLGGFLARGDDGAAVGDRP